jgi:crotonobetainyl-CoA:carnitine CoA-transferase CaiB-like acyl-CoA transferase
LSAFDGIRIIDASEGVAGGYCTRLLAGLGADVIKVERPRRGDRLRWMGPFRDDLPDVEGSGMHLHLNAAKRSITLDITSATGRALLTRLVTAAGVLLAGDIDPAIVAEVSSAAPDTVIATISPFGARGPRATWRATELVAMAASGYMSLNGDADREPIKLHGHQAELQAGLHTALGIAAARRARDVGGPAAERIDTSVAEAGGFLTAGAVQRRVQMDRPQRRAGPRPAGFAPNRLYPSTIRPCADGHVHVHCHNRFPDLISMLMDEPRLAAPEILAEPIGHADEVDALMDAWLSTQRRDDAVSVAQELRVPMTEVFTPAEVMRDVHGQFAARQSLVAVAHPAAPTVTQPGAPVVMPRSPWRVERAPMLGEHNDEIYVSELGLSPRGLGPLAAAGVI